MDIDDTARRVLELIQANHRRVEALLKKEDAEIKNVVQEANTIKIYYLDGSWREFTSGQWYESDLPVMRFIETLPRHNLVH